MQAPDDYYIYGDFTLTAWFKMNSFAFYARFLTLIRSSSPSRIVFSLTYNASKPYYVYNNGGQISNTSISYERWQHLAFSNQGSTHSIYIDGVLVYSGVTTPIKYELNKPVWFGSIDGVNGVYAQFDDIKIFNKSLSQTEIIQSSLEKF